MHSRDLTNEQREFMRKVAEKTEGDSRAKGAAVREAFKRKFGQVLDREAFRNVVTRGKSNVYDKQPEIDPGAVDLHELLKKNGLTVEEAEKMLFHARRKESGSASLEIPGKKGRFKFGVVSDTHLGAKTCALDELHAIYKLFKEEGVTDVLHSGDLVDGNGKVYSGQLNELMVYGLDDNIDYVTKNYPKVEGITTHFILGNHDESFLKTDGANIGKRITQERPDMKYLGMYDADLSLNGVKVKLHHGHSGGSYALTYRIQKYVENLTGERKPQIFFCGHYHTAVYASIRNIHCFTSGCFQKPNDFSTRLMLPNTVGGWLIEVEKTKADEVRAITPKFVQFYTK